MRGIHLQDFLNNIEIYNLDDVIIHYEDSSSDHVFIHSIGYIKKWYGYDYIYNQENCVVKKIEVDNYRPCLKLYVDGWK